MTFINVLKPLVLKSQGYVITMSCYVYCGSGNFLIIAFKELRKLEMEIIKQLQELKKNENQDD